MDHLPKLSYVYQKIMREERQQSVTINKEEKYEVVGFTARAGNKDGRVNNLQFRE